MADIESAAFTPKDPNFEARVRASFGRQGIMTLIGARLTRVEPGLVEIELPTAPISPSSTASSTPGSPAPSPIPPAVTLPIA